MACRHDYTVSHHHIDKFNPWLLPERGSPTLLTVRILVLSVVPITAHANGDNALLQFSMQVGSVIYTLVIVFLLVRNKKIRAMLLAGYLSLTVVAYVFAINAASGLSVFLTVVICTLAPFIATLMLSIILGVWGKAQ